MTFLNEFLEDRETYCAEPTIIYYKENLTDFIYWLRKRNIIHLEEITYKTVQQYILWLREKNIKNVSVRTYFRAVKAWLKWMYKQGYVVEDVVTGVKLPRSDPEIVIPLSYVEVTNVDNFFIGSSENGLRNFCIFHLMLDCGLRRSEVINLCWSSIQKERIIIKNSKYNKSRIVLLPLFLKLSLDNYAVYSKTDDFVFKDRYNNKRITVNTVKKLFQLLKKCTGIPRIYPHLLRHTFATSYLYYGGNMEMLRLLMGHSDYSVLKTYLHLAALQRLDGECKLYKLDDIYFKKN